MRISLFIYSLVLLKLCSLNIVQADSASCRKQVECFICDSREIQECEDARNFSQGLIPIRLCDDYCLKIWSRDHDMWPLTENKSSTLRYVRRDCHKIFRYQIKKAETCYKHSKYHDDSLCLCGSDRCNSAWRQQRINTLLLLSIGSILLINIDFF